VAVEELLEETRLSSLSDTEPHLNSGKVLIADDDPEFRHILSRRVARLGLSVEEVEDGRAALTAVRRHRFDVLVLDLYMPGATGLEVVEEAHKTDPMTQAILLTASASVETAVEALRVGVYDYLTKPLESLASFELSLTRALEHRYLIQENARLFEEIRRLALTDPLTGLYNRRKLDEVLELEIERARRYGRPLSLIMLDMDQMKAINDRHGHPAGDEVLRRVAQAIRSQVRRVDLPTRYGGDEFLVVLPEANEEEANRIAGRIRQEIVRTAMPDIPASASAGVAGWGDGLDSPEAFISLADQALYRNKRKGE
jgi:diguanylate cyclase (GGDEF)-like protein